MSALDRAKSRLASVKRDPARRRYRHHWERAIAALEKAARGRDRAPALLEAARARYALYRFSQVDADREAALRLAGRARSAGAPEAAALAAAIRREMGADEGPARAPRPAPRGGSRAAPGATPSPPAGEPEPSADPILERALAQEGGPSLAQEGAPPQEAGPARVSEVKSWSNADYTRVAVYLSHPVGFTREDLPAEGGAPRRLALDLKPALLDHGLAHPVGDALVARVRAAQHDPDTVRVVLDLPGRDELSIFALQDPPRLIVDVGVRQAQQEAVAAALRATDGPRAGIRRVIVDAGHGGHDAGAIGPSRVREKDVTLAMARRLAHRLRARGFEVVLTRDDDRFVPLEERAAIANARQGDLFISLHANAHPRRDRSGIETYVLDVADDRYAARLAARENGAWGDGEQPRDVRWILADLEAQTSADASRRLAEAVQQQLCAGVRARFGEARDLGVKSALFYVLLGARMPAVLVETSFISNRTEERRLRSPRFQEEVAEAVTRAVASFAQREARLAIAR